MNKRTPYIAPSEKIYKENIIETNRFTKNIFNLIIALGSIGFLIVGVSSYTSTNIIPILKADEIIFFPQGLTMTIYGTLGIIISINQYRISLSNTGEGFNLFDKENGTMTIFRKGMPGKNEDVNIIYSIADILRYLEVIKIKN